MERTCHAKTMLTMHCNANHVNDYAHLGPLDLPQIPWLSCTGNISIFGFGREIARHYSMLYTAVTWHIPGSALLSLATVIISGKSRVNVSWPPPKHSAKYIWQCLTPPSIIVKGIIIL